MKDAAKNSLESAVSKAGRAIAAVLKVYEEYGTEITEADTRKVFNHLTSSVNSAYVRADAMRLHVVKGFSLDTELIDAAPLRPIIIPTLEEKRQILESAQPIIAVPAEAPVEKKWVKPIGRLAGTKELIYETGSLAKEEVDALVAVIDNTKGIKDSGFIDT